MNKVNSCLYIFSKFPVFNPQEIPLFQSFDNIHSEILYTSLLLNYQELLAGNNNTYNFYFVLDNSDKEYLPESLLTSENIIWINNKERITALKYLSDKYFSNYSNNIIIPANSIGICLKDIKKTINLLSIEDDSLVVGKTFNDKISFVGCNKLNDDFFTDFNWDNLDYQKGLGALCKQNAFLNIVDGHLLVENNEEYKKLYQELSKKESLSYCSQNMHEKFTSLFIEYKDLLK
jgi:hypothetical protein